MRTEHKHLLPSRARTLLVPDNPYRVIGIDAMQPGKRSGEHVERNMYIAYKE
jgi:hypothetical protein